MTLAEYQAVNGYADDIAAAWRAAVASVVATLREFAVTAGVYEQPAVDEAADMIERVYK